MFELNTYGLILFETQADQYFIVYSEHDCFTPWAPKLNQIPHTIQLNTTLAAPNGLGFCVNLGKGFLFHVINLFHTLYSTTYSFWRPLLPYKCNGASQAFALILSKSVFKEVFYYHSQKFNMSGQVLASPLGQCPELENRPVVKYHANIWGDQFLSYTPEDEVIE